MMRWDSTIWPPISADLSATVYHNGVKPFSESKALQILMVIFVPQRPALAVGLR